MITLNNIIIVLACFCVYNTSKKALLNTTSLIEKLLQQNTTKSKILGVALIVIALIVSINLFGVTSGILYWLIALSTILSLLVVIAPLRIINYKHIVLLFLIMFIIEFSFFNYAS